MTDQLPPLATAFVSCSLRPEDKPFIDMVERILERHRIKPIGTVGKYSAAPMNPAEHMKQNIPLADFVVIVATPRYIQRDLQTGQISYGLGEMVHVETGMAYMANKPVVVFVQEGTHVGSFLPNITEYIVLNGQQIDLVKKWSLINSLINNAYGIVRKIKESESSKALGNVFKTGLAIFGGLAIADSLFSDNTPKRRRTTTKRKR
jgi:hypothetical protein